MDRRALLALSAGTLAAAFLSPAALAAGPGKDVFTEQSLGPYLQGQRTAAVFSRHIGSTVNIPGPALVITVPTQTGAVGADTTLITFNVHYSGPYPTGGAGMLVDGQNPLNVSCTPFGAPPNSTNCQWAYPTGSLAAGPHTITAFVLPDGNYQVATQTGTLNMQ